MAMAREANGVAGRQRSDKAAVAMALLSIAAIAAQPAHAQINPSQQTGPQGGSDSDDDPVGPGANVPGVSGFGGRGLAVSASVNSRYESNLSRRTPADDGMRFQPQITAEYGLGSSRLGVSVEAGYGRDIVRGTEAFKGGDRKSLSSSVNFALSRCTGQLGGSFRQSLNLRSDASQFGSFQQQTTTLGLSVGCRLGSALSANAAINKSDGKNTRSVSQALNVQRLTMSAGLGFNANALGQFSLGGSIANIDLPGRLVVTPNGIVEDGSQQRSLRFGYARAFGSRIRVTLGASLIENQPGTPSTLIIVDGVPQIVDRGGFSGLGYDASVNLTMSSRLSVAFAANRSANANPFVGSFLTIANGYSISANTRIGQYGVSAGARFGRNKFQGGFVSEFDPVLRRTDNFQAYFIRIGGRIGQRLRANFEVNHSRRTSDPVALNFTSTGAGLNLSMAFGKGN